eukprot:m51a1_g2463 hypothetical protein (775) ;mRNA; r:24213-26889
MAEVPLRSGDTVPLDTYLEAILEAASTDPYAPTTLARECDRLSLLVAAASRDEDTRIRDFAASRGVDVELADSMPSQWLEAVARNPACTLPQDVLDQRKEAIARVHELPSELGTGNWPAVLATLALWKSLFPPEFRGVPHEEMRAVSVASKRLCEHCVAALSQPGRATALSLREHLTALRLVFGPSDALDKYCSASCERARAIVAEAAPGLSSLVDAGAASPAELSRAASALAAKAQEEIPVVAEVLGRGVMLCKVCSAVFFAAFRPALVSALNAALVRISKAEWFLEYSTPEKHPLRVLCEVRDSLDCFRGTLRALLMKERPAGAPEDLFGVTPEVTSSAERVLARLRAQVTDAFAKCLAEERDSYNSFDGLTETSGDFVARPPAFQSELPASPKSLARSVALIVSYMRGFFSLLSSADFVALVAVFVEAIGAALPSLAQRIDLMASDVPTSAPESNLCVALGAALFLRAEIAAYEARLELLPGPSSLTLVPHAGELAILSSELATKLSGCMCTALMEGIPVIAQYPWSDPRDPEYACTCRACPVLQTWAMKLFELLAPLREHVTRPVSEAVLAQVLLSCTDIVLSVYSTISTSTARAPQYRRDVVFFVTFVRSIAECFVGDVVVHNSLAWKLSTLLAMAHLQSVPPEELLAFLEQDRGGQGGSGCEPPSTFLRPLKLIPPEGMYPTGDPRESYAIVCLIDVDHPCGGDGLLRFLVRTEPKLCGQLIHRRPEVRGLEKAHCTDSDRDTNAKLSLEYNLFVERHALQRPAAPIH